MTDHRGSKLDRPAPPRAAPRPGSSPGPSVQGPVDWTTFAKPEDIPEWVCKAYADTYQGPHNDDVAADRRSAGGRTAAAAVTPALLAAHYRLGLHRTAGESRVATYPPDDPAGFGPRYRWSPTTAR